MGMDQVRSGSTDAPDDRRLVVRWSRLLSTVRAELRTCAEADHRHQGMP
jgi:hypothetical protein